MAHLYCLSRDDFEHILHTFPPVVGSDEAGGMNPKVYRLVEVYDEMGERVRDLDEWVSAKTPPLRVANRHSR